MTAILTLIGAYLIGSIPFGLLITKALGMGDIRAIGSGNIGATNVLRTGNKKAAAATLILDGLKGFFAVIAFTQYPMIAVFGAILGHCFPIWLKFKGGKGVATYIGAVFGLSWMLGLLACGIWLVSAFSTRISSLSALIMIALIPIAALLMLGKSIAVALILVAGLIAFRHKDNITRIMQGTEPKIGKK